MSAILFTNAALFDGVGPELRSGAQVLVADGLVQEVSDRAIPRRPASRWSTSAAAR